MAIEQQLRVPGPTPLPERVVRSQCRPMINHRGPEAAAVIRDIVDGMRWALQTDDDILLFPASGTGGLEAAAANLLSPGERVLACSVGNFGKRWADIATAFGADVLYHETAWGEPLDAEDVDRLLARNRDVTTVLVTHNETSTGVVNDMRAIAAVVRGHDRLLVVDSVSGAGAMPLPVAELGLDCVVTGSQKGWMAPPGLAMISVGRRAWAAAEAARCPRFYFDFARQKGFIDKGTTYTTPPVTVMYALQEGLAMMREEGLENVFARHRRVAAMIRAGLEAIGLELIAPEGYRSDTVTAVRSPFLTGGGAEADGEGGEVTYDEDALKAWLTDLRVRHGLVLAGGQGQLTGRCFRVGHLGMIEERDVWSILTTVELGLADHGVLDRVGRAVPAAQAVLRPGAAARDAVGAPA